MSGAGLEKTTTHGRDDHDFFRRQKARRSVVGQIIDNEGDNRQSLRSLQFRYLPTVERALINPEEWGWRRTLVKESAMVGRPNKKESCESEHIKANIMPKIRRYSGVVKTNRVQGKWRYSRRLVSQCPNSCTSAYGNITDRPNWNYRSITYRSL
jgi:hypothetical protein